MMPSGGVLVKSYILAEGTTESEILYEAYYKITLSDGLRNYDKIDIYVENFKVQSNNIHYIKVLNNIRGTIVTFPMSTSPNVGTSGYAKFYNGPNFGCGISVSGGVENVVRAINGSNINNIPELNLFCGGLSTILSGGYYKIIGYK